MGAYEGCNDGQDSSRPQSWITKRTLFVLTKMFVHAWIKFVLVMQYLA
jgi:hypothetical protein